MTSPNFQRLAEIDEALLAARLHAVRDSIKHAGEKGRALEQHILQVLRDLLPGEYGLTTGFIAWHSSEGLQLSSQLDIIIYDAIRSAPLLRLGTCDVLPLEAVYGYVEVKASLRITQGADSPDSDSLRGCLRKNAAIREMRRRRYMETIYGSPMTFEISERYWLAVRAYIVAFEAEGAIATDPDMLASRMRTALEAEPNSHIHGILIPTLGFFYTKTQSPISMKMGAK